MKKKMFFKFFLFAVLATFVTFTACKNYDDDISSLEGQISALKTDLPSKIDAVKVESVSSMDTKISSVKSELVSAMDTKIKGVNDEITSLKAQLAALEESEGATKAELDAVKKEILEKTVSLEAFEAFKTTALAELAGVKADLDELKTKVTDLETNLVQLETELGEKASKEDLAALEKEFDDLVKAINAYKLEVTGKFETLQASLDMLDVRVVSLEMAIPALKQELEEALGNAVTELETKIATEVSQLESKIAGLRAELETRIDLLEAILKIKEGESEVINDIYTKLGEQLDRIVANEGDITDLQEDLEAKYNELVAVDDILKGQIAVLQGQIVDLQSQITANKDRIDDNEDAIEENKKAIKAVNDYIKDQLEPRLEGIEGDIETIKGDIVKLQGRMETAEKNINLNVSHILTLSRQLKGLTFIPTRGLPSEKTMKLYYYAGDYTANHTIMYRVNPSNAKLGRDFTIASLNYQITTRSASDGVNDASEDVSVALNGEVTQMGDIIYVPVHIQGPNPCTVFGNHEGWMSNDFFFGENRLWWGNNVRQYENGNGNNEGLSLVITAMTNSIEEGKTAEQVYVKSSEMVNTELIPTQIKLAESDGKGNQIIDENLEKRVLNFTLREATDWANLDENELPAYHKNWNVLTWSGNQGQGGVWTPGELDLNDYVSSFYYPQDGGDLSREDVSNHQDDPHRYLYAEFGKEFGKPYIDKPNYEKPVYVYEQMIWKDTNHNIIIGPKNGTGVTHTYVELKGSILTVLKDQASIQGVRNKKIIIKVTQVNSDCKERQPVGYLVLKYSDDPLGQWPDAEHTVGLTEFPYYHKGCGATTPAGEIIPENYQDGDAGASFTHKNALLELFTADRFMSPINAPNSYGLTGKINPGDVNVILGDNLQLNGIGEHNMGNIYNIQRRDASVVANSVKFTAAANNHINDALNKAATGETAQDAFRHVMIRYEYDNHSYIVYVDDNTPAGDYEITYKLENKENNTQHGNVLYLTFKFKVALRDITVVHDENSVNWQDDNKTLRVQHARIHNSIEGGSDFLSDEGYRVNLKQAFVLDDGTVNITTQTLPAVGGVNAGAAPGYRVKFEFIQDATIKAAGFTYKRDADNYLTEITYGGVLAAKIENSPTFNYLNIEFNKEGDLLYNYLMQDMLAKNDLTKHNIWTKWGGTELTNTDDMERLLPVRMVTDINGACEIAGKEDMFPNGNYYYIDDFNIKFERALRFVFTTVELTDDQQLQAFEFDFHTKDVDSEDESKSVYRGLFDHAYYDTHGIGNVVHPGWTGWSTIPYTFTNPSAEAAFYGLPRPDGRPMMFRDSQYQQVIPGYIGTYNGLDYKKVEISTDGGNTWKPADQDYSVLANNRRFFNIINQTVLGKEVPTAIWQGDETAITSPIYFRVPVVNQTAIDNGLAPVAGTNNYWMSFRAGYAGVKGYAVFKINPRN